MENRRSLRTRKRFACALHLEEGRSSGLILDVSATGLFIQTGAKLDPGDRAGVEFEPSGGADALRLEVRVVRRRAVPARLKSVAKAGIGVEIEHAPEGFFAMIAALQAVKAPRESDKPAAAPPRRPRPVRGLSSARPGRSGGASGSDDVAGTKQSSLRKLRKRFKVEVHEIGGKGARIVEVEAMNAAGAARKAQAEVGDDWKVVGCEVA